MATAHTSMPMVLCTSESGVKTNNTAEELKNGRMVLSMRADTRTARSMAMEYLRLLMGLPIQDSLRIMRFQAWESMSGQMIRSTKACGKETRCMAKASWFGKMENGMKASSSMTKEREEEFSNGKTAEYTRANGKMENSTELEYSLRRTRLSKGANGKTERR
jgi:hypothetical protein